jgi:hydrogenase/urease accessory protein HupE
MFEMERPGRDFHRRTLPLPTVNPDGGHSPRAGRATNLIRSCLALALILASSGAAFAHPAPFSYVDLRVQRDGIDGTIVTHIFDVAHDLNIADAERLLDPAFAAQQSRALAALLGPRLSVLADGRALEPQWSETDAIPDRQSVRLHVRYRITGPPGVLTVNAAMFPYDTQHQTFLNIYDGEALTQAILDGGRTRFEYFAGTRQGAFAVIRKFVPAGVHHILIGPDHLLFLVGLLLLGGTIRQLATVVTAFTVAHSITLSLAALSLVSPPARIVEPAIALSIVYVGADNLLVREGRDVRAWIAFAFGFIHGFGFANVLREMDLPARALGWSLFSFNLGVEIGQLLVVVAVALALQALRSRSEAAGQRLAFAGSLVVIAAGTFWFVQRVFFAGGIS